MAGKQRRRSRTMLNNYEKLCRVNSHGIIAVFIVTLFAIAFVIVFSLLFGSFEEMKVYMNSTSFRQFTWPLEIDAVKLVTKIRNNKEVTAKRVNDVPLDMILKNKNVCVNFSSEAADSLLVLFVIKSAVQNFKQRQAIRDTWGDEQTIYVRYRGTARYLSTRHIFLIGAPETDSMRRLLFSEHKLHNDLLVGKFKDSYFNNTRKTAMGLTFAATYCKNVHFVLGVDDDFYISKWNVGSYLISLPETEAHGLYTGFYSSGICGVSRNPKNRRYTSLNEYKFTRVPPYIYAGAYIISMENVMHISAALPYVAFFKIDDVYLGIVALKLGIELKANNCLFIMKDEAPKAEESWAHRDSIAIHGFKNDSQLLRHTYKLDQMRQKT